MEGVSVPEWKVYYLCRNLLLLTLPRSRDIQCSFYSITLLSKYLAILPWQRKKFRYLYFYLAGALHEGLKGISGEISLAGREEMKRLCYFGQFRLVLLIYWTGTCDSGKGCGL